MISISHSKETHYELINLTIKTAGLTKLDWTDFIANKMLHIVRLFIYSFVQKKYSLRNLNLYGRLSTKHCCYTLLQLVSTCSDGSYSVINQVKHLLMARCAHFSYLKISFDKMTKNIDQMEISHVCVCVSYVSKKIIRIFFRIFFLSKKRDNNNILVLSQLILRKSKCCLQILLRQAKNFHPKILKNKY